MTPHPDSNPSPGTVQARDGPTGLVRDTAGTSGAGCATYRWKRFRDVGQAGSLRGGWLPPLSGASAGGTLWVRPIDNRPQLARLPHNSVPCLAYTYARIQAVLPMNRVGIHFCVAHPVRYSAADDDLRGLIS